MSNCLRNGKKNTDDEISATNFFRNLMRLVNL